MAHRVQVMACTGTGCVAGGSYDVAGAIAAEAQKKGLTDEVQVIKTGCQGFCAEGPDRNRPAGQHLLLRR